MCLEAVWVKLQNIVQTEYSDVYFKYSISSTCDAIDILNLYTFAL